MHQGSNWAYDKALAAISITASNSYENSDAAREAHRIAGIRLWKLRDEAYDTRLQTRRAELAALRAMQVY